MKFLISQNRHKCIPVGRIEEIAIVKEDQFWKIEVISNKTGKGQEKRFMGAFDVLEDAENAMKRLMQDFVLIAESLTAKDADNTTTKKERK